MHGDEPKLVTPMKAALLSPPPPPPVDFFTFAIPKTGPPLSP